MYYVYIHIYIYTYAHTYTIKFANDCSLDGPTGPADIASWVGPQRQREQTFWVLRRLFEMIQDDFMMISWDSI